MTAGTKISDYPDGGSPASGDKFVIARGGQNYSVDGSNVGGGDVNQNLLSNGGMRVVSRGAGPFTSATTFVNNDDAYLIDGWVNLANGSDTCDISQISDTDFVSGYAMEFDVETANRRFGLFAPIEKNDIQGVRKSGKASLQFKVKCTGTSISNVRAYVLAWNGTANSITSDVISAWGSAGSNPTFATNWTAENTGSNIAISTSVALVEIANIDVDTSGVTNLGVLIIVDDTDAQVGDKLIIGDVKLENGTVCTDYTNPHYSDEISACMRYVEPINFADGQWLSSTVAGFASKWRVEKITAPTISLLTTTATVVEIGVGPRTASSGTIVSSATTVDGGRFELTGFSGATTQNMAVITTAGQLIASSEL